jgi:hypothetical protein
MQLSAPCKANWVKVMGIRLFFLAFTVLVSNSLWASLDYTQAIYGKDDREFISKMSAPKFKTISSSVALIISKESIEKSWFGQQIQADSLKNVVLVVVLY